MTLADAPAPAAAERTQIYETFRVEQDGPVATLTLSRPQKRNALARSFWIDLPAAVKALSDAGETRVLIIQAEGPHFTAGMDISVFAEGPLNPESSPQREAFMTQIHELQDAFTALEKARFPVIAAVQGYCLGAGVDMITACDLRYCTADASFRIEEINIGMTADVGTLQRLPKIIPEGLARELAYLGDTLDAHRADRMGLVNGVLPDTTALQAHALEVARKIASKPPLAITGTKQALNYARDHSVDESLAQMRLLQASIWSPADMMEAFSARAEKRDGTYVALAKAPTFRTDGDD